MPRLMFSIFVAALALLLTVAPAGAAVPANIKLCYLQFTRVDDLGYTFSFNVARLKIHENIQAMFPNSTVVSMAKQEVFFMSPQEKKDALADFVRQGCHVVSTNGAMLLHDQNYSEVSALYPNVTFFTVAPDPSYVYNFDYPNIVFMVQVPREAFYLKGAAAARQASTCVGLINAFELKGNAMDSATGALRGIRDEHPTIPIHVITMDSWYWPDAEIEAARLLMRLGCEVIMHYTDPRVIDLTVKDEAPGPGFFSIGAHSNLQLYVGDSVLVASYVAWDVGLTPLIAQALRDGRPTHPGAVSAFQRGVVLTTDLSPLSSQAARDAFARARARLDARPNVLCGPMQLRNGTAVATNPSTGCINKTQQTPLYIDTTHTTFHPLFRHRTDCPAGTFASYEVTPVITLSCIACPENTFTAEEGQMRCTPCPNGTVAETGSTVCTQVAAALSDDGGMPAWTIAVIVVAVVIVLGAALAAPALMRGDPLAHCPLDEAQSFAVMFVAVANESALYDACTSESVKAALGRVAEEVRAAAKATKCYHAQRVNDGTFMLVATTPARAMACATRIAEEVNCKTKWRNVLKAQTQSTAMDKSDRRSRYEQSVHRLEQSRRSGGARSMMARQSQHGRSTTRQSVGAISDSTGDDSHTRTSRVPQGRRVPNLRVSIGIATGFGSIDHDPEARTAAYRGDVVNAAAATTDATVPGQVLVTEAVVETLAEESADIAGTFDHYREVDGPAATGGQATGGTLSLHMYSIPGYAISDEVLAHVERQREGGAQAVAAGTGNSIASALTAAATGVALRRAAIVVFDLPVLARVTASPAAGADAVSQLQMIAEVAAAHRGELHDVIGTRVIVSVNAVGGATVSAAATRAASIASEAMDALTYAESAAGAKPATTDAGYVMVPTAGFAGGSLLCGSAADRGVVGGTIAQQALLAQAAAAALGVGAAFADVATDDVLSKFNGATVDVAACPDPQRPGATRIVRVVALGAQRETSADDGEWLYAFQSKGGEGGVEAIWGKFVAGQPVAQEEVPNAPAPSGGNDSDAGMEGIVDGALEVDAVAAKQLQQAVIHPGGAPAYAQERGAALAAAAMWLRAPTLGGASAKEV